MKCNISFYEGVNFKAVTLVWYKPDSFQRFLKFPYANKQSIVIFLFQNNIDAFYRQERQESPSTLQKTVGGTLVHRGFER